MYKLVVLTLAFRILALLVCITHSHLQLPSLPFTYLMLSYLVQLSSDFWVLICQQLALVTLRFWSRSSLLTQQLSFYLPSLARALCFLWFPGMCTQNLAHLCVACILRSSETWDFVSMCAPSFVWFLPLFKTSLWVCPFIISCLDNGRFPPMFNCNCG